MKTKTKTAKTKMGDAPKYVCCCRSINMGAGPLVRAGVCKKCDGQIWKPWK